jgi:2-methylcitrate dehydratase PrpD
MPFGAAVAILYKKATLDEYTLENLAKPEIKALMEKILCEINPELEKEFPRKWPALATVTTRSGREFSAAIEYPKGDPENPLTWDELIHKFSDLVAPVYTAGQQKKIIDRVRSLEAEKDMNSFSKLLLKV